MVPGDRPLVRDEAVAALIPPRHRGTRPVTVHLRSLLGEVGPAVADPVALGECPVEQDVIRIGLAQDPQEARCPAGQVLDDGLDVGVGGADGYAEAGGDLRERVVPTQVDQAHEGTLVGRQLAAAVTLTSDDEHRYPLDQSMRQVECGRMGTNRAPVPMG